MKSTQLPGGKGSCFVPNYRWVENDRRFELIIIQVGIGHDYRQDLVRFAPIEETSMLYCRREDIR